MQRLLLRVGENLVEPRSRLSGTSAQVGISDPPPTPAVAGQVTDRVVVILEGEGNLPEVVLALPKPRRLAGGLNRGHKGRNEQADNKNDYE